jgi:hypothetical protein
MPKIVQYNLPPGGTVVDLADNQSVALEIEGVDQKDYILVDTSDGSEKLYLKGGGTTGIMVEETRFRSSASGQFAIDFADPTATNPVFQPAATDSDTGIGWAAADQLSLIAGGVEGIRLTESGSAVTTQINGSTHIKIADTNVTADTSCDDLVIEGTGATGVTVATPNNVSGCVAFRSENTSATDKSTLMIQGLYNSSNKAVGLLRLMSGSTAADYIGIEAGGAELLKVQADGVVTIAGAMTHTGNVEIENASPTLTFDNSTAEDSDGGRESQIDFTGLRSGSEAHTLARVQVSHDGAADDNKGKIVFQANDGSSLTEYLRIQSGGQISTGGETAVMDVAPKGSLHVMTGDSTVTDVTANADDLIVEGSGNTGISICTTASFEGSLTFVDPSSNDVGLIGYHHQTGKMRFKTEGSDRFLIDGNGKLMSGGEDTPLCVAGGLHLLGPGGTTSRTSINPGSGMLVLEDNGSDGAGLTIIADDAQQCKIDFFTDTGASGRIIWQQSLDAFRFFTNNKEPLRLYDDGISVFTGATPTATLDVKGTTSVALSNTVASDNHSGTPRVINSTAHGLEVGDTVGLLSGNSNTKEIFTVAVYNSANQFTVDSDPTNEVGTSGSNNTGYRDGPLLITQSGDGRTIFRASSDNTIIHADGTMSDTTATQSVLLCTEMGDSNPGDKVVFIGARAGKGSTGNGIVAIGSECCESGVGLESVVIGYFAGNSGPSSYNTMIGARSGSKVTSTGNNNTFVGSRSGAGISDGATSVTTGDHNVCIGAKSGAASTANNQIAIGYESIGQGENTAVIGNSNIVSIAPGSNKSCSLGTATEAFGEVFCDQVLINHTVEDDCWTGARDLVVGSKTNNTAGIYIKAASSSYSSSIAMADGVGTAAQAVGGLLQYIHNGDYWRIYAKYDGSGPYQFRMNEYGVQKHRNSLAQDSTARDDDTDTDRPAYLADTNATLILDYEFGTVAEVTLAANVTAIKIFNAPAHGSSQTMTVKIKQHSTAVTLSYSSVTIYSDSGSTTKAGNLLWSGGAEHVLSTGNNQIDIVQFTCMPHGDTNRDVYAAVIGQNFS